ncbi:serine/threonine-protein kinase DCLK3 [Crotalus adamanteus]|uniref:Serine/threonine-protein kinase DCLK3 n=1 Tax=Crotalus adamanteus TaxID=8729 RepID=A0AAW1B3N1_CROAD
MECHHRSTNQIFAMKIIDKSKLKGKEDMLENEILIIKSLSHPNIVSLIEVFETEEEIHLIMEYVPGGDLFDAIIESMKFTEHDAALMITDLCEALVYIHSKNIVHRDLKPENLLVQRNPDKTTTLKLADFGLAKQKSVPPRNSREEGARLERWWTNGGRGALAESQPSKNVRVGSAVGASREEVPPPPCC